MPDATIVLFDLKRKLTSKERELLVGLGRSFVAHDGPDIWYAIMQKFVYGWDVAPWTSDGEQNFLFRDHAKAEKELEEFLKDMQEAFERGDMDEPDPSEYAIVPFLAVA